MINGTEDVLNESEMLLVVIVPKLKKIESVQHKRNLIADNITSKTEENKTWETKFDTSDSWEAGLKALK